MGEYMGIKFERNFPSRNRSSRSRNKGGLAVAAISPDPPPRRAGRSRLHRITNGPGDRCSRSYAACMLGEPRSPIFVFRPNRPPLRRSGLAPAGHTSNSVHPSQGHVRPVAPASPRFKTIHRRRVCAGPPAQTPALRQAKGIRLPQGIPLLGPLGVDRAQAAERGRIRTYPHRTTSLPACVAPIWTSPVRGLPTATVRTAFLEEGCGRARGSRISLMLSAPARACIDR